MSLGELIRSLEREKVQVGGGGGGAAAAAPACLTPPAAGRAGLRHQPDFCGTSVLAVGQEAAGSGRVSHAVRLLPSLIAASLSLVHLAILIKHLCLPTALHS
jgi:hypothetical protein